MIKQPRYLVVAAAFVLLLAAPVLIALLAEVGTQSERHQADRWFGHTASAAAIFAVSLGIWALRKWAVGQLDREESPPPGLLVGFDNRLSTSKLSTAAWTWAIAWAILSLAIAQWAGASAGWEEFLREGLKDEYLVLLGGPFVALVSAKALVQTRVADGAQVKPPAEGDDASKLRARASQAFSDDSGQPDIVDVQYLLFGAVALIVFLVMFVTKAGDGLPEIPDLLVAVSGLGATVYVGNKWNARSAPPTIERVVPDRAGPGETIAIYGTNLLSVSQSGGRPYVYGPEDTVTVLFGSVVEAEIVVAEAEKRQGTSGSDWIKVTVPRPPASATWKKGELETQLSFRSAFDVLSSNDKSFTFTR